MLLLRRALRLVVRLLFRYDRYYLYEYVTRNVENLNEADFMPRIDNFTFKVISTNQEADELEAAGLEFRSLFADARERLDKGAIAFCTFVGREFANIGWAAMSEEASESIKEPPMKVDFAHNEACMGVHGRAQGIGGGPCALYLFQGVRACEGDWEGGRSVCDSQGQLRYSYGICQAWSQDLRRSTLCQNPPVEVLEREAR